MAATVEATSRCFESAVVTGCRRGEVVSGDVALLLPLHGAVLVAAIDGAGHGSEASRAARRAATVISRSVEAGRRDLSDLMRDCHVALHDTRGAAVSLALLSCATSTITWLGIGNVEGRIVPYVYLGSRRHESLRMLRGVVGHDLPALSGATLSIHRGDLIAFASDGVAGRFADRLDPTGSPAVIAERILTDHWNGDDDGLVAVIRWLGAGGDGR